MDLSCYSVNSMNKKSSAESALLHGHCVMMLLVFWTFTTQTGACRMKEDASIPQSQYILSCKYFQSLILSNNMEPGEISY